MTNEHVERDKELTERIERFVEERGMFPLYTLADDKIIHNLLDMIEELEHKCEQLETQEHVELSLETRERLDRFKEQCKPLCEGLSYSELIERALIKLERMQGRYDKLFEDNKRDVALLFDACLIAIQRDDRHDTVKECKDALVRNVAYASSHDEQTQLRLCYMAEEHNKTKHYDDAVFSWRA